MPLTYCLTAILLEIFTVAFGRVITVDKLTTAGSTNVMRVYLAVSHSS